ncbi:glycosyltransferase family 2 protein [Candidatus Thioglobus sp.]|nr:glycosyltransferase family 2 protein [Candidatus Thioglobus sp.]
MNFSLIITTYNSPNALLLVLKSIEFQLILPNEVIIADDGSLPLTSKVINDFKKKSPLNILHSWHEDRGFRVAKSRNKAIAKSNFEYIILIDGDTILHPSFSKDHLKNSEPGFFIQGKRVLLTKNKTKKTLKSHNLNFSFFSSGLKNRINSFHSNALSNIFSVKNNHLRGIKTCNMSFFKQDFLDVNGFNNEFEGWGREDSEFIVRLMNKGANRKTLRFNAVQYHLWHQHSDVVSLPQNERLLLNAIEQKLIWCDKGVNKIL